MSATKSFVSALVGVALSDGCLAGVDQKMSSFFPEYAGKLGDPRKAKITLRQLLQMRAGYPWEGREAPYLELLFFRNDMRWVPHLVDFPLMDEPGARFGYSNLTSHLIGAIVTRACKKALHSYLQERVLAPIGADSSRWHRAADGYDFGAFGLFISARDMARFGSLYLHRGKAGTERVLEAAWVDASFERYSEGINFTGWFSSKLGSYFDDPGYGYQWWSATTGDHRVDFAWGHGGNLIVLVRKLDMIVVATADPLYEYPEEAGWQYEGAVIDLVGEYLDSL